MPIGRPAFAVRLLVAAGGAAVIAGCSHGPVYQKPDAAAMPVSWKVDAPWRESAPDDAAAKGPWWQRFGDTQLDALETQALANSPTLQLASARLAQAKAQVAGASAGLFPQIGLGARAQRLRT